MCLGVGLSAAICPYSSSPYDFSLVSHGHQSKQSPTFLLFFFPFPLPLSHWLAAERGGFLFLERHFRGMIDGRETERKNGYFHTGTDGPNGMVLGKARKDGGYLGFLSTSSRREGYSEVQGETRETESHWEKIRQE